MRTKMKMTEANLNPDSDKPKVMICPPGEAHVDAAARIGELFRKARIGDRNGAEVLGSIEDWPPAIADLLQP
jgi:hypothetical protein